MSSRSAKHLLSADNSTSVRISHNTKEVLDYLKVASGKTSVDDVIKDLIEDSTWAKDLVLKPFLHDNPIVKNIKDSKKG